MRLALRGALPELIAADAKLTSLAAARGITYELADFGGVRSPSDTTRILNYRDTDYAAYVAELRARSPLAVPVAKDTWRPIAAFGNSFHNWGAAFDVRVTSYPKALGGAANALAVLQSLAPAAGLVSGATFPTRKDPPHMQLAISLAEAKRRFQALGGVAGFPLATAASVAVVVAAAGALGLFALLRTRGGLT